MERNKIWLMAGAMVLVGALLGWGASRLAVHRTPLADSTGTLSFDAREAPNSLTPSEPYRPGDQPTTERGQREPFRAPAANHGITVAAGTPVAISVHQELSSGTAHAGETWTGTVSHDVIRNGRVVIPAGSPVRGTVAVARSAERGDRATLQLALSSVTVNGRSYHVRGSAPAVVAGSPRVRNVGAIAGGTAAGALIGHAVGGSSRGTLVGALLGGGAASVAVAKSKGFQARIPAGRTMEFVTRSSVTVDV